DTLITVEIFRRKSTIAGEIMEQRPDRLVAESFIIVGHFLGAQEDRRQLPVAQILLYLLLLLIIHHSARPSDPKMLITFEKRAQARREPAFARSVGQPAFRGADLHRQPVRYIDYS